MNTTMTTTGGDGPDVYVRVALPELTDWAPIGRGGFATVWRAREAAFDRQVAVKVIDEHLDDANRARFEREMTAIGRVSGISSIVAVYRTMVTIDGRGILVMEYCPGGSLANESLPPLSISAATEVIAQISAGLTAAHATGMLHLDVKPANILVAADGSYRLSDFGLARLIAAGEGTTRTQAASYAYASPEQLDGEALTTASDVWMLAATFVALTTGRPPFSHGVDTPSIRKLLQRIVLEPLMDLTAHGIPGPVAAVVARALEKDPAQRVQTPAEFAAQLVASAAGSSRTPLVAATPPLAFAAPLAHPTTVLPPPPPPPAPSAPQPTQPLPAQVPVAAAPRSRKSGKWAAVAVVVVAALIGGYVFVSRHSTASGKAADTTTTSSTTTTSTSISATATTLSAAGSPVPAATSASTRAPTTSDVLATPNGSVAITPDQYTYAGTAAPRVVAVGHTQANEPTIHFENNFVDGTIQFAMPKHATHFHARLVLDDGTTPPSLHVPIETLVNGESRKKTEVTFGQEYVVDIDVPDQRVVLDLHMLFLNPSVGGSGNIVVLDASYS